MSRKTYPPRLARAALGIRAQDLRTLTRKAWWARRWIAAVEALRLGARLGRGRQYAVSGQVTDLQLAGPRVTATVLGSRPQPYTVELTFTTHSDAALDRLSAQLRTRPVLLARLLTDDLPTEVETLFAEAGCPLFPVAGTRPPYDVKMTCSCPDWAKPCKHIAAVLLLLGEEVAHHPLTLLALRGILPEDILPPESAINSSNPSNLSNLSNLSTPSNLSNPLAMLRRLGPVPFWRGIHPCQETLEKILSRQQNVTRAAANGESVDLRG